MKLQISDTLLETDYIEYLQKVGPHSVKVYFTSGAVLDVVCGLKTASLNAAVFNGDANAFLVVIENIEKLKPEKKK